MKTRPTRVPQDPNLATDMRAFLDALDRKIPNHNWTATTDPAVTDDSDSHYEVGSHWLNTTSHHVFVCTSAAVGAAVWTQIS